MPSILRTLAATLLTAMAPGCCYLSLGLSSLFCGPRAEPWVEKDYSTARSALGTFLGAISRDDSTAVYLSLTPAYRRELAVDELLFDEVVWPKIKEELPGIHLVDHAEVHPLERPAEGGRGDRAVFRLELAGHAILVRLERLHYYSTDVLLAGTDRPQNYSSYFEGPLTEYVTPREGEFSSPVWIEHPGPALEAVGPDEVIRWEIGRTWRVAAFWSDDGADQDRG